MTVADIESLDLEAQGLARVDGKVVFIDGALPGERVEYRTIRRKPRFDFAVTTDVLRASAWRVVPRCPHFGVCGGCSMQHLDLPAQSAIKQRALEDQLWHIARLRPEQMLPAIQGPAWGYRHRARLTARVVAKKGGALVGFHEKRSSYVADMTSCAVLPERISRLLPELRRLVESLSIAQRMPQIELSVGDIQTALVLRVLEPPSAADLDVLRAFAARHDVSFYLQPGGPDSVQPLAPDTPLPAYLLPEFGLRLEFRPTDFTQVNHAINQVLVRRALTLLDVRAGERIADLFCGLGNFTLPIARSGARVVGIEGSETLVARARSNAALNGLTGATEFAVANLFDDTQAALAGWGRFDKLLIDPPREGALAVVKALPQVLVARIVYVSCNPATLARDAAVLAHEKGYRLAAAGIVNMFPHTSHVESVALFLPA